MLSRPVRCAVLALLAFASPAIAGGREPGPAPLRDPLRLLQDGPDFTATFAGASATNAAYLVSPPNVETLGLVVSSEARSAAEAGQVRRLSLRAPLGTDGRLDPNVRRALLAAADALGPACLGRDTANVARLVDLVVSGARVKLPAGTRVTVEEALPFELAARTLPAGVVARAVAVEFTLTGGAPRCAMPVPRR